MTAPSAEMHTTSTFAASAVVVWVLQMVKKSEKVPWITKETAKINRIVAVLLSGVAALGVTWVFAPAANGGHTLSISIPSAVTLVSSAWLWLKSFAIQEWIYRSSVNGTPAEPAK